MFCGTGPADRTTASLETSDWPATVTRCGNGDGARLPAGLINQAYPKASPTLAL